MRKREQNLAGIRRIRDGNPCLDRNYFIRNQEPTGKVGGEMTQQPLFAGLDLAIKSEPKFDGATFSPALDQARLNRQLRLVLDVMKDGQWRTLRRLAVETKQPEASISARLRDLRKERFGAWNVDRMRMPGFKGVWMYRVVKP